MVKVVNTLIIVIMVVFSTSAITQKYSISGIVQQTFAYCGGAVPTQEILKNFATPKAFANKTFYVRKGKKNNIKREIIAQFTSDSNGEFSFQLPKGVYSILVEEQVEKADPKKYTAKYQTVDEKCLEDWWQKPYFLLCVKSDKKDLKFLFNHRCYVDSDVPCVKYTGPKHP